MTDVVFAAPPTQVLAERRRFRVLRKLAAHRSFKIGLVLVTILVLCAIIGPMLTGIDPSIRMAPEASTRPCIQIQ